MSVRKVVTASVAALALAVVSVPVVSAQSEGSDTGALSVEGLAGGSLEGGSLASGSLPGQGGDESEGGGSGSAGSAEGSAEGLGSEDSSLSDLVPDTGEVCELPSLGGSLAKFYPLFGISGVPSSVIKLVTDVLDTFPNLVEIVAGQGTGAVLLGQTGSMNEALCTSILGGKMVMPPVTVIVDGDGTPITTVTGTIPATTSRSQSTTTSTQAASTTSVADSDLDDDSESGTPVGGAEVLGLYAKDGSDLNEAVPTTVPTSVPTP